MSKIQPSIFDGENAPPYFETSVAVLSTIGLCLTGVGLWTILVTRFSLLHTIPVVTSAACALANGLCYYAFYTPTPPVPQAVASIFADLFWLIQEAGLPIYSYQILVYTLRGRARTAYMCPFWTGMAIIVVIRFVILTMRAVDIINHAPSFEKIISYLHIIYFTGIALIETYSAFFLVRLLRTAYRTALAVSSTRDLFKFLLWSTELRLASLCFVGLTRAVAYPFRSVEQHAIGIPDQFDRLAYTVECLFPIVICLDIIASKTPVKPHLTCDVMEPALPDLPDPLIQPLPREGKGRIYPEIDDQQ